MKPHPRFRSLIGYGLTTLILSITGVAPPGVAQSPKATGTGSATKKSGGLADSSGNRAAVEVLKFKNLRRSGSTYVIGSENVVQRKLAGARQQLAQFRQVAAQQQSFEFGIRDRKAFEDQLLQQRAYYNQQIIELDRQTPSIELAQTNQAVNITRNEMVDQHNRLVALVNEANDRLRLLHNQGNDSELKQKVASEVARYREAYMQTIVDIREIVDQTRKSYEDLAKDPEITAALSALNETSKVKFKLGPSREFLSNVASFEKIEKSVLTEMVEVRKADGVYWLDVTFNGKVTKPMVFDTGAGVTSLSSKLAAEIGLRPKPSDPTMKLQTADGTIVEAKQMTVGSMRVGKFTVKDVVCAVMPPEKGDVSPLLGQSFHRHFTYKFTPESGRLTLSQVEESDPAARGTTSTSSRRKTTKSKRGVRSQASGTLEPASDVTP